MNIYIHTFVYMCILQNTALAFLISGVHSLASDFWFPALT